MLGLCQSNDMAIRSFPFLLAALPALSLGCAQGGQTYDDGSDGVNSSTDGEDDDVGDDDVTDDDAADDDTSLSCSELNNAVYDALSSAAAALDKSCTVTSDCVVFEQRPSCVDGCGNRFVANQSSADLSDVVDELEDTVCRDFDDAACEVIPSPCPVDARVGECIAGQCQFVGESAICGEIQADVVTARDAAVDEVNTSCEQDEDCEPLGSQPRCLATCGGSLALGNADASMLDTAIGEIEDTLCREFDEAGCVVFPPGCPSPPIETEYEPRCVENECAYVEVDTADQCADLSRQAEVLHGELVAGADTTCETVDECTVVLHSPPCALSCTLPIAVNLTGEDRVRSAMASTDEAVCTPFDELACPPVPFECASDDFEAACLDGRCVLPSPTASDCYAPDQNLDLAYSGTISGCPCSDEGSICILPVALVCSNDAWQAVEDGPCSPGVSESPCDGRVDSPMDCVDLFETCFELSTGSFCGVGHTTDLCPDGMIVQDAGGCLQDDATCVELENGLYCTG